MKKNRIFALLASAAFCSATYGQRAGEETPLENVALEDVEVVAYRLKNISYTDSAIALGAWSNLRLLDIPYSIATLTSDMMKNLQVSSLNEVSKYMPSMQIEARGGLEVGRPQTRGFQGSVVECSRLDGMNIVSTTAYPMEQFDRFEVLNGIAGSLYGPASPAGSFCYSSKRVNTAPTNDASISYQTLGLGTYHADVSRRYFAGNDTRKSFGLRANALYADGEGFTEYSNLSRTFISGAFDAQYNSLAIETHLSRYSYKQYGYAGGFSYGKNIELPTDLDPTKIGYGQEWAGMDLRTVTANVNIKYTVGKWKITAGALSQTVDRGMLNPGISLTADDSISYTLNAASAAGRFKVFSNRVAVNGLMHTGRVAHSIVAGTSGFIWSIYSSNSSKNIPLGKAEVHTPLTFSMPQIPPPDGHYKTSKNTQQSLNIGDNITFNKHFSAMLSLSYNIIDNESYAKTGEKAGGYNGNGFCYSGSLLYKPVDNMTIYGAYSDVIQQGAVAPKGAANADEVLDPYRCKQYELGYKVAFSGVGAGVAIFDISRPFPFLDSEDNAYKLQGVQRNRGIEAYGDAVFKRLHATGGITLLNPKLKDTGIEETSGTDVVGVPKIQANLFVEYRLPALENLSVNGNVHHTGSKAANDINTLSIEEYTTFDVGLRYTTSFAKYRIVWNLQATNLLNKCYWASIFPGSINGNGSSYSAFLGSPREIKTSVRLIF
ncbi:MAG: TonB-dependent receptor plug domain-containing protein [Prevotellaceae bacterium]|nr:TonB-dependent receptor plug domain-containing protein [Prevotellaceae bacterium]